MQRELYYKKGKEKKDAVRSTIETCPDVSANL